jgi:hypothetical protein
LAAGAQAEADTLRRRLADADSRLAAAATAAITGSEPLNESEPATLAKVSELEATVAELQAQLRIAARWSTVRHLISFSLRLSPS